MSYEYTVNIPADKRATFRSMVKLMGGSLSRARKVEDAPVPNDATLVAIKEIQAGGGTRCESFDDYLKAVSSL